MPFRMANKYSAEYILKSAVVNLKIISEIISKGLLKASELTSQCSTISAGAASSVSVVGTFSTSRIVMGATLEVNCVIANLMSGYYQILWLLA